MKKSVRDQAIRSVTASLLSSSLSAAELAELAQEMTRSDFGQALSRSLAGALQLTSAPSQNPGRAAERRLQDLNALIEFVQKKKLTKAQIHAFISAVFPQYDIDPSITTRGQLDAFLQLGGTVSQFISGWDQVANTDPYLKAIIDRIRTNNE